MKTNDFRDFVHTGPGTLAGRYLRMYWQPVYRSADLEIGRPVRIEIMSEFFTLYRGESGTAHLVADRCAHRGTQLLLGWVEGECIRCFYHGWVYDGSGQCIEQPAEKESFARKVKIASYPVEEYLGLIFAYLGEGKAPPRPRFPELETESLGPLTVRTLYSPCNFFQRIENDLDETHLQFVHQHIARNAGLTAMPKISSRETEYGIFRISVRHQEDRTIERNAHFLMPNSLLIRVPPATGNDDWSVFLGWRVPIDDENALVAVLDRLGRKPAKGELLDVDRETDARDPRALAEDIIEQKIRIQDVDEDYPHLFYVQDNVVLMGQGAIADRDDERLGRSDAPLILLRKLWKRELKALAEGRPVKIWKRPKAAIDLKETIVDQESVITSAEE